MAVIPLNAADTTLPGAHLNIVWGALASADTGDAVGGRYTGYTSTLAGALQGTGTWGGATLTLDQSVDGVNWAPVLDVDTGLAVALTASTQVATISVASPKVRPRLIGGSGAAIVPRLYLRG